MSLRGRYPIWVRLCLIVIIALAVSACGEEEPSRWEPAQQTSEAQQRGGVEVADEVVPGSEFNAFFPDDDGDLEVFFVQEKEGFAQAKIEQDGQELAQLSVSDTAANPSAAEKFATSNRTISGYPAVDVGNNGTAVLVADRFQVQVRSSDPAFTADDREAWIERFDLDGLSQL